MKLEACQADNFWHLNAGEDPYVPQGGEKAKTVLRKQMNKENGSAGKESEKGQGGDQEMTEPVQRPEGLTDVSNQLHN